MNKVEEILERFAPLRGTRPDARETWKLSNLPSRLGLDVGETEMLLASGMLKPLDGGRHGMFSFSARDLDFAKRFAFMAEATSLCESFEFSSEADFCHSFANSSAAMRGMHSQQEGAEAVTTRLTAALHEGAYKLGINFEERLTGKLPSDRYIKKINDEDLNRRDANILRSLLAGGAAGAVMGGPLSIGRRAAIGAGIGAASLIGIRKISERGKDQYGDRSRGGKQAENLPVLAAGVAGAIGIAKRLGAGGKIKFSRNEADLMFSVWKSAGGSDIRMTYGESAYHPEIVNFVAINLPGIVGGLKKAAGVALRYPILAGAGIGAVRAETDDDPETGIIGGVLKGAAVGELVGTGAFLIKNRAKIAGAARAAAPHVANAAKQGANVFNHVAASAKIDKIYATDPARASRIWEKMHPDYRQWFRQDVEQRADWYNKKARGFADFVRQQRG